MPIRIAEPGKLIRKVTVVTLSLLVCYGLALVLAQLKPFWVDEWRVIYNLKYKNSAALLGPLDFMQQFPRVYLEVIKAFAAPFDYSYFTLRLPSFLVGTAAIIFGYRLMKKIYPAENLNRYLFVVVLVSSYTFTEYFIQVKQYTMDILLSLVAIAQLIEVYEMKTRPGRRYTWLCLSFIVVPFFSYIYPVVIAPVFLVIAVQQAVAVKQHGYAAHKKIMLLQWLPLALCAAAIVVFYVLDMSQVMADKDMHRFWSLRMMRSDTGVAAFFGSCYELFAQVGRGLLFSILFGILGIAAFFMAFYKPARYLAVLSRYHLARLYSVVLLVAVLGLYCLGKLPLGEPRLNVCTIPAITILIIALLDALYRMHATAMLSRTLSVVLYAGVIGHIYTTSFSAVTGSGYARKLAIYVATENAIILAQAKKLPILITPGVAYPYHTTQNLPFSNTVPGDWVLKTFPAYKVAQNIPVYNIDDLHHLSSWLLQLQPAARSVLTGDGLRYQVVNVSGR